jgi:hypothetical protein
VAFIKDGGEDDSYVYISVISLDGGQVYDLKKVYEPDPYGWNENLHIWWTHEDHQSIYYEVGGFEVRKITLLPQNGSNTVKIRDICVNKMEYRAQRDFVDISMDGRYYFIKQFGWTRTNKLDPTTYTGTKSSNSLYILNGDTSSLLEPVDPDVEINRYFPNIGCGEGVAPSGSAFLGFQAHHAFMNFNTYDAQWALTQEINLEYTTINGWETSGHNVPTHGNANGWSCNSDEWALSEIEPKGDSDISEQLLVNKTDQKAIITSSQIEDKVLRGSLWCSTRDDVNDNLWTYVEQRDTWNEYWDTVLKGNYSEYPYAKDPFSKVDVPSGSYFPTKERASGIRIVSAVNNHITVSLVYSGANTVTVWDTKGNVMYRTQVHGAAHKVRVPSHLFSAGLYIVSVENAQRAQSQQVVIK